MVANRTASAPTEQVKENQETPHDLGKDIRDEFTGLRFPGIAYPFYEEIDGRHGPELLEMRQDLQDQCQKETSPALL